MKAYVDDDGQTRLFRPEMNMRRMNNSAARLCLPQFDGAELLECIKELLRVDKEWIPTKRGYSMYLRPVIFSTTLARPDAVQRGDDPGAHVSGGTVLQVGFRPDQVERGRQVHCAWPGGTGNIKYGGNYGSTVISQKEAASGGASQSLYVYDVDEFVTEAGTMNIFFLWTNEEGVKELVTPTLEDGTILPGVTRQSAIDLAKEWGECKVTEKLLPFREVAAAFERGEVWGDFRHGNRGGDPAHRLHPVPGQDLSGSRGGVQAWIVPAASHERTMRHSVRRDSSSLVRRHLTAAGSSQGRRRWQKNRPSPRPLSRGTAGRTRPNDSPARRRNDIKRSVHHLRARGCGYACSFTNVGVHWSFTSPPSPSRVVPFPDFHNRLAVLVTPSPCTLSFISPARVRQVTPSRPTRAAGATLVGT